MAKKDNTEDELSLDEAINAVRRLAKPERKNEELELLKQASAKLLEEVQPGFEFEDEEGGGGGSGLSWVNPSYGTLTGITGDGTITSESGNSYVKISTDDGFSRTLLFHFSPREDLLVESTVSKLIDCFAPFPSIPCLTASSSTHFTTEK